MQEWVQSRPRNEALDCLNYALAARRLAGKRPIPPSAAQTSAQDPGEQSPLSPLIPARKPAPARRGGFAKTW